MVGAASRPRSSLSSRAAGTQPSMVLGIAKQETKHEIGCEIKRRLAPVGREGVYDFAEYEDIGL